MSDADNSTDRGTDSGPAAYTLNSNRADGYLEALTTAIKDPHSGMVVATHLPSMHVELIVRTMKIICNEVNYNRYTHKNICKYATKIIELVWALIVKEYDNRKFVLTSDQWKVQKQIFLKHFIFPRATNLFTSQQFGDASPVLRLSGTPVAKEEFTTNDIMVTELALTQCILHAFRFMHFENIRHAVNSGWHKFCVLCKAPTSNKYLLKAHHVSRWATRMETYFNKYNFVTHIYKYVPPTMAPIEAAPASAPTPAPAPVMDPNARTARRDNTTAALTALSGSDTRNNAPNDSDTPRVSPPRSPAKDNEEHTSPSDDDDRTATTETAPAGNTPLPKGDTATAPAKDAEANDDASVHDSDEANDDDDDDDEDVPPPPSSRKRKRTATPPPPRRSTRRRSAPHQYSPN